jgi:hypothetical protein
MQKYKKLIQQERIETKKELLKFLSRHMNNEENNPETVFLTNLFIATMKKIKVKSHNQVILELVLNSIKPSETI